MVTSSACNLFKKVHAVTIGPETGTLQLPAVSIGSTTTALNADRLSVLLLLILTQKARFTRGAADATGSGRAVTLVGIRCLI